MNIDFSKPMINNFTLTHVVVGKILYMFKEPCKFRVETNSHCIQYRDGLIVVENYEKYFKSEPFIRGNFYDLWKNGHTLLAKEFELALTVKEGVSLEDCLWRSNVLLQHFIPMTILPEAKIRKNNKIFILCLSIAVVVLTLTAWYCGFQRGTGIW